MSETTPAAARRLPPVTETAVASMALVITGGIYLAAYLPQQAPLALPIAVVGAGAGLLLVVVSMLMRLQEFAWDRFFQVSGWALVPYVVIAGMFEFVFVVDQTRGALLALMTVILVIFALDIPIVLAFSVARHQDSSGSPPG